MIPFEAGVETSVRQRANGVPTGPIGSKLDSSVRFSAALRITVRRSGDTPTLVWVIPLLRSRGPSMPNIQTNELHEVTNDDGTWSNPAKISRKVRELANRSHRVLKAGTRQDDPSQKLGPQDTAEDLSDLRAQVARLQQKIHARRLGVLVPWVDALRLQVEDRLGNP